MHGSFVQEKISAAEGSESRHRILHPQYIDDVMLWSAFRSGDEQAFITIFDRFSPAMFNYGCKISPEREVVKDAVQELFIDIWQNRKRLGDTDSIKFYLFKSLRRKLLRIKGKHGHAPAGPYCADDIRESTPSHELVLIDEQRVQERKHRVMSMLSQLSKRQQEALFLRYFEELNCDQIASVMRIGKQAVYNLIYHALEELKKANASVGPFKD